MSHSQRLRFKIKCTSPFNYIVKPYELTIAPGQEVVVSIRAVIGDREFAAFGFDKFEVLWKPVMTGGDMLIDKNFWKVCADRRILGVTLVSNPEFKQRSNPPSEIANESN